MDRPKIFFKDVIFNKFIFKEQTKSDEINKKFIEKANLFTKSFEEKRKSINVSVIEKNFQGDEQFNQEEMCEGDNEEEEDAYNHQVSFTELG